MLHIVCALINGFVLYSVSNFVLQLLNNLHTLRSDIETVMELSQLHGLLHKMNNPSHPLSVAAVERLSERAALLTEHATAVLR